MHCGVHVVRKMNRVLSRSQEVEKIRVLIIVSNLGHGGAERQIIELINNLDDEKFAVFLCSFSEHVPLANTLKNREERLFVLPKRHRYDFTVIFQVYRLLKQLRIDILHGFLIDAEITSRLAGFIAGTPIVIGSERNTQHNYSRVHFLMYRLTSNMMHLCIANSKSGSKYNQRIFKLPEMKYRVVSGSSKRGK